MEFLYGNLINTTSMLEVDSGTITAFRLFDPDKTRQWVSDGQNSDSITSIITVSFAQTLTIDRIILSEHNGKDFKFIYNRDASTTVSLVSGDTSTLHYTGNSQTSQFFKVTPFQCTSLSLYINKTIEADSEKAIGFMYVGQNFFTFPRIPAANNYRVSKRVVRIEHKLSDGGIRLQKISEKWNAQIKLVNIEKESVKRFESVYNYRTPVGFAPFGTCTGWDGIYFGCSWTNDFDMWEYSDNARTAGFEGTIRLAETPW